MWRSPAAGRATLAGLGVVLWLVVVVPLAVLVHARWQPLLVADRSVVDFLEPAAAGSPAYRLILEIFTSAGTTWFRLLALAPAAIWAFRTGRVRLGALLVVAASLIGPLTSGLKLLVGRHRPEFANPIFAADSLSHPSGHAAGIVTLVGLLLVAFLRLQAPPARRATSVVGVVAVLIVGLTRMALGAHYPSDVLAGFALGAGWVLILTALFDALPSPASEAPEGSSSGGPMTGDDEGSGE